MREYIGIDILTNWVSMMRSASDSAIWLADDDEESRFYARCAYDETSVISAPAIAMQLLESIESRGIEGIVATVRGARPPELVAENVFHPPFGDVISFLLAWDGSNDVIRDICGAAWLISCEKEIGSVRCRAAWIARLIDQFQKVLLAEGILVPDPINLIRWDTFEISWDKLLAIVEDRGLPVGIIEHCQMLQCGNDLKAHLHSCDGLGTLRVLSAATFFFRPRGIRADRQISVDGLIGMLRTSFDLGELEQYEMYWRMKKWERVNYRYPLLRQWRRMDPLGVLLDQRYWRTDLDQMLRFLQPNETLAAFKMDLDNFKIVNESLGHTFEDEAIGIYCSIVLSAFRNTGEVYRRGGDEIIAFAPGLGLQPAETLAEKIRALVETRFKHWGQEHNLSTFPTASIGLVVSTKSRSPGDLILLLDDAQGKAKQLGKNRTVSLT